MENPNSTLSLAVVSGKGGVGKTSISLNIAYALYDAYQKVLIIDCDLGLANLDVMLGLSPSSTLQDLLQDDIEAKDVVLPIEENGFDLLPAASGVAELVDMDDELREKFFQKLRDITKEYHFIILDVGAGISETVLDFASMVQARLVIITPEPTSLTDGYALIKVLKTQKNVLNFNIIVNQADNKQQAETTFERLSIACKNFIEVTPHLMGFVHTDTAASDAIRSQKPLLRNSPNAKASQDIKKIAESLINLRTQQKELLTKITPLKDNN